MREAAKKLLSLMLAVLLVIIQSAPVTAEDAPPAGEETGAVITAFEPLPLDIAEQRVPIGTAYEELLLPDTLTATVSATSGSALEVTAPVFPALEDSEDENELTGGIMTPADITPAATETPVAVDWLAQPEYEPQTADTYIFTPVIENGFLLAEGVTPPAITVMVEENAAIITITAFDPLPEDVAWQGYDYGTVQSEDDLLLPDTLTGADTDGNPFTIEGMTWESVPPFDPEVSLSPLDYPNGYVFTPKLPQGYALAEGVSPPVISVFIRPEGGVEIVPMNLNEDLAVGTWTGTNGHRWVEFGGILWRVLEVTGSDSNKTAFLLADESVTTRNFHSAANAGDGNWINSDIRAWLNSEGSYSGASAGFLNGNFDEHEKAAIVTTSYTLGGNYDYTDSYGYGKDTEDSTKVFLLSTDEAGNPAYFKNDEDRIFVDIWWLRSPGRDFSSVAYVNPNGNVNSGVNTRPFAIRPALKINLSSPIFSSKKPLYEAKVEVKSGGVPVARARISFSGALAPDENFSNSAGGAIFYLPIGTHNFTVSKLGYTDKIGSVTVTAMGGTATVELSVDASGLPPTVQFGQHNNSSLIWQLLDIDRMGKKALLLADSFLRTGDWATINSWINNTGGGGFLEPGVYFTAAEQSAMLEYAQTSTKMFLLSRTEAETYFPVDDMRYFPNGSTAAYWLRSEYSSGQYDVVNKFIGTIYWSDQSGILDARPAVWVDLTRLFKKDDSGSVTLTPAYSATVHVKDGNGGAINGASVTLTPESDYRTWDGEPYDLTLTGQTSGGAGAVFALPQGSYGVTVEAWGYSENTGILTVTGDGDEVTVTLTEVPTVATPTFSPDTGTYTTPQQVTITTTTADAVIYYTLDGTAPTANSTIYSNPITIGSTTTIKAIAYKDGMTASEVATANYTINLPPSYTATLSVHKDGAAWSGHSKVFTLKLNTDEATTAEMSGSPLTATVGNGIWKIYDGTVDTGVTITIDNNPASATLDYYTIQFSVQSAGSASGSNISATYDGGVISSGAVMLGGKTLVLTANGGGATNYAYAWSGMGVAGSPTNSILTIDNLAEQVNAVCTVTGSTPVATITGVSVKTQPTKLTYTAGETLNLTGLEAALNWSDGASNDVGYARFGEYGIVMSYSNGGETAAHGDLLSTAHNGKTVTLSVGGFTANTNALTVNPATVTYSVTVNNGTGGGSYAQGETITITADPAPSGQIFDKWTTTSNGVIFANANSATTTFIMPARDVTVTANWSSAGNNGGSGGNSGGGSNNGSSASSASLSVTKKTYDKKMGGDISVTLNRRSHRMNALKNGGYTLDEGTDYIVSGNMYTIKAAYLNTLDVGKYILTFDMNSGADPKLTVTVVDTSPPQANTANVHINGYAVKAEVGADGALMLTGTADDINGYRNDNGKYEIEIPKQDNVRINLPISSLGGDSLTVKTDFGTVNIPSAALKSIGEKHGNILRLVIEKGSFTFLLLDESDREIAYNGPGQSIHRHASLFAG